MAKPCKLRTYWGNECLKVLGGQIPLPPGQRRPVYAMWDMVEQVPFQLATPLSRKVPRIRAVAKAAAVDPAQAQITYNRDRAVRRRQAAARRNELQRKVAQLMNDLEE